VINSGNSDKNSDKQVGLYSGGLIFGGGAYNWNEMGVSTCGGLIHGGGYIRGGVAYIRRFTVFSSVCKFVRLMNIC
jgi:hypothetical protein